MVNKGLDCKDSEQSGIYDMQGSITRKIGKTKYILNSYSNADKSKNNTMLWHMERLVKSEMTEGKIPV